MRVTFASYYLSKRRTSTPKVLGLLLETLVEINTIYLVEYPQTPLIYQSGVKYRPEKNGAEDFRDIGQIYDDALRTGRLIGDCEDLAAWRVAEARVREGLTANEARVSWMEAEYDGVRLYHIQAHIRKVIEDPSRIVGRE